jgi:hypothetical protein
LQQHSLERLEADKSKVVALPSWVRVTLFAVGALVLVWLILTRSLAAYLALVAPDTALLLRSNEPTALIALADDELRFRESKNDQAAAQPSAAPTSLDKLWRQVETALAADPLNARAYRLLGQLAEANGADARATRLMQAAARHSLSDPFAVEWMMRKSFEKEDFPAAAYYADIFLRARPNLINYGAPILGRMAENEKAKAEVQKILAANPPWRPAFFQTLGAFVTDARTPLDLLFALQETAAPPRSSELRNYLSFLFQHKLYGLAYYAWLQFLPPEQLERVGLLNNGGFETRPSRTPFDWAMPPGTGVIIAIRPRPEAADKHALLLEFTGTRAEFAGVYQTTVIPPGSYRFTGHFKGELFGRRGMQWRISCLNGPALGASEMFLGLARDWRAFEFAFTVPDSGCTAQAAQLVLAARSPSEKLVSGSIWFDDLSISRRAAEFTDGTVDR